MSSSSLLRHLLPLLFFLYLSLSLSYAERWDSANHPAKFSSKFSFALNSFSETGILKTWPWSDTYWPSYQSGIAHRWNSPNPQDWNYKLYSKTQLKSLSQSVIAQLSPAEKYDIFVSRYDYPTVKSEWTRTQPNDEKWEGLCHGWAPASMFYEQPNPVTLTNGDGITIPFGSSDIKALLTYFVAEYDEQSAPTQYVGNRCQYNLPNNPQYDNTTACKDVNAGSLHVILANQISKMNQGFVIDRDRGIYVWNQPLFYYNVTSFTQLSSNRVKLRVLIAYGKETAPAWTAHDTYVIAEDYGYVLELDSSGNIIGGEWKSWDRPDFVWKVTINQFWGYLQYLSKIYTASINGTAIEAELIRSVPQASNPNHKILTGNSGSFGIESYGPDASSSWSLIGPTDGATKLILSFTKFNTTRSEDKLKIYEEEDGTGPLIAVLHGNSQQALGNFPKTLPLQTQSSSSSSVIQTISLQTQSSSSYYVTFKSSRNGGGEGLGFSLQYQFE